MWNAKNRSNSIRAVCISLDYTFDLQEVIWAQMLVFSACNMAYNGSYHKCHNGQASHCKSWITWKLADDDSLSWDRSPRSRPFTLWLDHLETCRSQWTSFCPMTESLPKFYPYRKHSLAHLESRSCAKRTLTIHKWALEFQQRWTPLVDG
jgi:hypothetical protein